MEIHKLTTVSEMLIESPLQLFTGPSGIMLRAMGDEEGYQVSLDHKDIANLEITIAVYKGQVRRRA